MIVIQLCSLQKNTIIFNYNWVSSSAEHIAIIVSFKKFSRENCTYTTYVSVGPHKHYFTTVLSNSILLNEYISIIAIMYKLTTSYLSSKDILRTFTGLVMVIRGVL